MKFAPSKIICVGLNYRDHAAELNMEVPTHPILFMKPPSSVIGDGDDIVCPEQMTNNLHYEAELAIVIKEKLHKANAEQAKKGIFGYTCANDVTARDLQKTDGQWTRAKGFDTFCPLGPEVATGIDPDDLSIKLYLNGELKQDSRTSEMVFKPVHLVSWISHVMTLMPGDVILTGTPAGVGPMKKGDQVIVEIEGVGKLKNRVV